MSFTQSKEFGENSVNLTRFFIVLSDVNGDHQSRYRPRKSCPYVLNTEYLKGCVSCKKKEMRNKQFAQNPVLCSEEVIADNQIANC